MKKSPYYCENLTSRILKSFSDRVIKQLDRSEVHGFSVEIHTMKVTGNNKIAVAGTFKVSSKVPVTFKYPKLYSNSAIRWSSETTGTEAGLTEKTLQTKSVNFAFEI